MKQLLVLLICGLFVACAESTDVAEETPRKVDLNLVVANGSVSPIGGLTPSGQPDEAALT